MSEDKGTVKGIGNIGHIWRIVVTFALLFGLPTFDETNDSIAVSFGFSTLFAIIWYKPFEEFFKSLET